MTVKGAGALEMKARDSVYRCHHRACRGLPDLERILSRIKEAGIA